MKDGIPDSPDLDKTDEMVLDPTNLDAERHALELKFEELVGEDDSGALRELALGLSPGDLSEILRPLSVEDTSRILRMLPPDPLAEVLSEIDNRSQSALFALLDIDEIADIIEEMPSDEAADVIGELDTDQAAEVLAAMEENERIEVADLLQYPPETAGGLMGKEFATCNDSQTAGQAVAVLRELDEDDLAATHFVYVLDSRGHLVGRLPLISLLLTEPGTMIKEVMEADPLYVEVDLDQEEVAGFFQTHDLISLPVVDHRMRMVGNITADDVLDVMEEEATEDISRLAGVSKEEFGEQSSFRVAQSRLPWLLGALLGQLGAVLVMSHYEKSIESMVALTFYIPMIMATAGNIGIQTSSVVVRGLATGEVDFYHLGRHLMRELGTAVMTGVAVAGFIYLISWVVSGDPSLSLVLSLAMLMVVLFAAMAGSGIPLMLHRFGIDPAVATGPFITTANDFVSMVIYLGLASLMLSLGHGA
ncbi:MAG: magnesium transporter [Candidatus Krumholzibacteria bacterium]|nr:magnesium transporter [Candidatus Krumholzibacteria bacterium]